MKINDTLIRKYNVAGPRYTSYPTVPFWENDSFSEDKWKGNIIEHFLQPQNISLYVHLPYCEKLCTFCGCNTRISVNHMVETPYVEAIHREWKMYTRIMHEKPIIKELHLGGGTPTFFCPANLVKLVRGIIERGHLDAEAEMSFEGHPNNTSSAHLKSLYDVGFRRVSFGIQDFDPTVQEAINRVQPFENVQFVTDAAREIGYTSVNFDIVYGLPFQSLSSIRSTIEQVLKLMPDRIAFYSYAHVPWLKPGQRKFTEMDLPDNETKRSLYEYGRATLESAGYKEIGMDHFALEKDPLYTAAKNKTLHRNFMGYTPVYTPTLIGLGVSSISDLGNAYAQNVKTVEEYYRLLHNGKLPVFKGHFLTTEDFIIRKHISNIMCRQTTSWSLAEEKCKALSEGLLRLKPLETDGLVTIYSDSLEVTEAGLPFIRNICMALDARLHRSENKVQFSKTI